MTDGSLCPCGSQLNYSDCCRSFHTGTSTPQTAEALMRSRYSAYVKKLKNYLLETWHSSTRPEPSALELEGESGFRWLSLEIISSEKGGLEDNEGKVAFIASFKMGRQKGQMQEHSSFVKENGRWYYIDAC